MYCFCVATKLSPFFQTFFLRTSIQFSCPHAIVFDQPSFRTFVLPKSSTLLAPKLLSHATISPLWFTRSPKNTRSHNQQRSPLIANAFCPVSRVPNEKRRASTSPDEPPPISPRGRVFFSAPEGRGWMRRHAC